MNGSWGPLPPMPLGNGHSNSGCFVFCFLLFPEPDFGALGERQADQLKICKAHAHTDLHPSQDPTQLLPLARARSLWRVIQAPAKNRI